MIHELIRLNKLKVHEEELNRQKQDLDDRTARHARREQSKKLQEKIAHRSAKFTLTSGTRQKRLSIHIIFIVLLSAAALVTYYSLTNPPTVVEGVILWLELGRLPFGMAGFALTALYYIRWNDHWFKQHADQEFKLQQLALDVDRAGYVTEMLLEWQEDKGVDMPAMLIDRLTTGLFIDQTSHEQVRHPSEDITKALIEQTKREN